MSDHGVVHIFNGIDVDRPRNEIHSCTPDAQVLWQFGIYFEPVGGQCNTYRTQAITPFKLKQRLLRLPITRTLSVTQNRTIDPPSPRLLALHRAIGQILYLSGAGEYIG